MTKVLVIQFQQRESTRKLYRFCGDPPAAPLLLVHASCVGHTTTLLLPLLLLRRNKLPTIYIDRVKSYLS